MRQIMDDLAERYDSKADAFAEKYRSYLKKLVAAFVTDKKITALLDSNAVIYTEYPFSLYISRQNNPNVFAALESVLPEKICKELLPAEKEKDVWVNGIADLVAVYPDGKIHLVDYKSDDPGNLQQDKFMQVIHKRYDGQMELYRQMAAIVFATDIDKVTGEFYTTGKGN